MPKFFINQEDIKNKNIKENSLIELTKENANHIINVLRLKIGDKIEICNNNNNLDNIIFDYTCEIIELKENNSAIVKVLECLESVSEPNIKIVLYQGLPKSEKMELIIQKGVELGVSSIVPIATERAIVKLAKGDKQDKKIARWNKISESASKQSKRSIIPQVTEVLSFDEAIKKASSQNTINIIPYEQEKNFCLKSFCNDVKIKYLNNNNNNICIGVFIGPEGGFTTKEISSAITHKVVPVTLGKRILRTETAGFITSAILLYELENY